MAAWLLREGEVLAALDVASGGGRRPRRVGRGSIEGALLVYGARSVHTLRAGRGVDIAYCCAGAPLTPSDAAGKGETITVLDITSMPPNRLGRPRRRATCLLAAEVGAFERWRLRAGDQLEIS